MNPVLKNADFILDNSFSRLQDARQNDEMDKLYFGISKIKNRMTDAEWKEFCKQKCHHHQLLKIIHLSKISHRAFQKPRGYAGDAVLMDMIYGIGDEKVKQEWEYGLPGAKSVRQRYMFIAKYIDTFCEKRSDVNILSIACGHLRESLYINAFAKNRINTFFALDSDQQSLENIDRSGRGRDKIKLLNASFTELFRKNLNLPALDFIYSLGLLDYLNDAVAQKLLSCTFKMLKPKGRIIIANYAPNMPDSAYMEAFLDWQLIYRDEFDMQLLLKRLPGNKYTFRTFRDTYKNIVFMEIQKA